MKTLQPNYWHFFAISKVSVAVVSLAVVASNKSCIGTFFVVYCVINCFCWLASISTWYTSRDSPRSEWVVLGHHMLSKVPRGRKKNSSNQQGKRCGKLSISPPTQARRCVPPQYAAIVVRHRAPPPLCRAAAIQSFRPSPPLGPFNFKET